MSTSSKLHALFLGAIALTSLHNSRAVAEELREWTDFSGDHKTLATFISVNDYQVSLKLESGKEVTVPVTGMSEVDQEYVKRLWEAEIVPTPEEREMLDHFERQRQAEISALRNSKNGAPTRPDEGEIVRRNEEISAAAPSIVRDALGGPMRDLEYARANYAAQLKEHEKAIAKRVKEIERSVFVPTYDAKWLEDQHDELTTYSYMKKFEAEGRVEDAKRMADDLELLVGLRSVGNYPIVCEVQVILDEKMLIARTRIRDDRDYGFGHEIAIATDTSGVKPGDSFSLAPGLCYIKDAIRLKYDNDFTGRRVHGEYHLLIQQYASASKVLEDRIQQLKRPKSFDPVREAARRFQIAKSRFSANAEEGAEMLKDVCRQFPNTDADRQVREFISDFRSRRQ